MKLLITGGNGFLGSHLLKHFSQQQYNLFAITKVNFFRSDYNVSWHCVDLTDAKKMAEIVFAMQPNVIVHTAAMSKPNECEADKNLCLLNNVTVVKILKDLSERIHAKLIFTSSDFVFGNGFYCEEDARNPLNFYGQTKVLAEDILLKSTIDYCIVRPVFIYGKQLPQSRKTFVQWVAESLQHNKTIKVVNDQHRTPTYVEDICVCIEKIITKNCTGIYHIANTEILTPYEMAMNIAEQFSLNNNLIEAVDESSFKEPVARSKKCILNIDKAVKDLEFIPTKFLDGLKLCM